jgi:site-specific DNA-cytosine methylase
MRLRTLDLFSGIGGFSFALHPICRTVAYCECDEQAVACLTGAMMSGYIDRAPVFPDVRTLDASKLRGKLDVITAGFPCTDLSSIGSHKGFQGAKSQLMMHVFRVVDSRPDVTEFPSSGTRRSSGDSKRLLHARFCFVWAIFSAGEMGAPHQRSRFFGMAQRDKRARVSGTLLPLHNTWSTAEPCPRIIRKSDKHSNALQLGRLRLLGNSVVPDVVSRAFTVSSAALNTEPLVAIRRPRYNRYVFESRGADVLLHEKAPPPQFSPPCSRPRDVRWEGSQCRKLIWPTPVSQNWRQCRFLSFRTCGTLANQIFYDFQTTESLGIEEPRNMLSYHWMVNPEFIEYMMGYPLKYTSGALSISSRVQQ